MILTLDTISVNCYLLIIHAVHVLHFYQIFFISNIIISFSRVIVIYYVAAELIQQSYWVIEPLVQQS